MKSIIKENQRRNRALNTPYDPIRGVGCIGKRTRVDASHLGFSAEVWLPKSMLADEKYSVASTNADAWVKLRCHHDFEFWCATCVKIKDKLSGQDIPFHLNAHSDVWQPSSRVSAQHQCLFALSCLKRDNGVDLPSRRCTWHGYNRCIATTGIHSSAPMLKTQQHQSEECTPRCYQPIPSSIGKVMLLQSLHPLSAQPTFARLQDVGVELLLVRQRIKRQCEVATLPWHTFRRQPFGAIAPHVHPNDLFVPCVEQLLLFLTHLL